ncbi:MAG: phosphatidylserine/phosphatidylglycerophosphate/cardiolipin synthase family protein [Candidatus Aminicenantales bacterium]
MSFRLLVDSNEFADQLLQDVSAARSRIYIQAMTFDADRSGLRIARVLKEAAAPDRRVLIDDVSRYIVSDRFIYSPGNWRDRELRREWRATRNLAEELRRRNVGVRITNPYGPLWRRFLARNHKKLAVIDGRISYIGGINFSDHNFAWHDMMLRIDDPDISAFLEEDFLSTWENRNASSFRSFPGIDFYILDGTSNARVFELILNLVRAAREGIFIESTYFALPFFDRLREIGSNRPPTVLLTSAVNNWPQMRHYLPWEARRSGIELRLYPGRLTHLKAILVDGRELVMGSANFDFFSYSIYQEIVAVVRDPSVIAAFKERVVVPDLKISLPFQGDVRPFRGRLQALSFRALVRMNRLITRL